MSTAPFINRGLGGLASPPFPISYMPPAFSWSLRSLLPCCARKSCTMPSVMTRSWPAAWAASILSFTNSLR